MWDEVIRCMACPDTTFQERALYAEHVKSKWHLHNTNCRIMGNPTLSEEDYNAKFGEPAAETVPPAEAQASAPSSPPPEDNTVTVCIMFTYQAEKWSHKFSIQKGSTVWDLKKTMVKSDSPEEDLLSFSLKQGMIRAWNFETIESDETYEFHYIGPEEGQRFLDRDKQRKQRDEDEAREREEGEQRRQEEKRRQEEEREQRERQVEERRQQEEAEAEQERQRREAEAKWWEEEGKRMYEEEERRKAEEQRQAEEEEQRRRQAEEQQEAARKQAEEEERERRRQAEEQEERRRRQAEEEARVRQAEEEAQRRQAEEEEQRRRQAEEEEKRRRLEVKQAAGSTEPIEVVVHIDRALEFKTTLCLTKGTSIREVKERLASDDPTGQLHPKDLGMMNNAGRKLDDDEVLTEPTELELEGVVL